MSEANSSEATVNLEGFKFLENHYGGFENLAKILSENGGIDGEYFTPDRIVWFLNNIKQEAEENEKLRSKDLS